MHPSVVPPRRVISGADYGTICYDARARALYVRASKITGPAAYTPDAPRNPKDFADFTVVDKNDATVDNDRH